MARIIGTSASEILSGTRRDDKIFGMDGDDTILSSDGNDFIDGGLGTDTVDYSSYKGPLEIVFDMNGYATVIGNGVASDTLFRIENLIGGRGNDYFGGNSENNTFWGNGGHDYFLASGGSDTYYGGKGYDTVDFSSVGTGIELKVNARDVISVWAGPYVYDKLVSIENIIGTKFDDILRTGSTNDYLRGGEGHDILTSGKGGDVLDGGLGNDTMTGGEDKDTFYFADGYGCDLVTDFCAHGEDHDLIELYNLSEVTGFRDLMKNHATQNGDDVVIDGGNGNTLTLSNVDLDHLTKDMFVF
ncbi:calcium-binding protein [Rhizobium alvei]|uniref:Calcium-binding protein n=1 Tax=Rhizobium alvei TaxID=1132659 RepID=A0ABT8YHN2_9HYPH|nr:hypothetical protein [Rhizobium alvei]MDO6963177.1 hypothetical protein [Rhizobium alvei]